jgi:hypothetical protein
VIAGPYTGEFGFELLRWLPYLRAKGERFTCISRGGNQDWYPTDWEVLNLFDVVSPAEFRELYLKRGREQNSTKQRGVDELDRLVLERFKLETDLHPSEMWSGEFVRPRYERLLTPPRYPGLPDEYVAARLYQNDWLRDPPKICEDLPIVDLKTRGQVDTHTELKYKADIVIECDIETVIATQNQVIAHAKKFICPYGGMVYVGLLHGIPVEAHATSEYAHPWFYAQEQTLSQKFGGSVTRVTK